MGISTITVKFDTVFWGSCTGDTALSVCIPYTFFDSSVEFLCLQHAETIKYVCSDMKILQKISMRTSNLNRLTEPTVIKLFSMQCYTATMY